MFVTAAVLCTLQLAAATCDANSVLDDGTCKCNVGTACSTCCTSCFASGPISSDAWGCNGTFASYPDSSSPPYQCIGNLDAYCDTPSRDQSYSSFRSGCTTSSTQVRHHISAVPPHARRVCAMPDLGLIIMG